MNETEKTVQGMTHDYLRKELYVIFSTPAVPREEIAPLMPDHLAHQVEIEREGILFGAGPMFEEGADAPGRGMIIVRADSFDAARKIADSDPLHKAGLRTYTIERWMMNEGTVTVRVNYSDQTMTIV